MDVPPLERADVLGISMDAWIALELAPNFGQTSSDADTAPQGPRLIRECE